MSLPDHATATPNSRSNFVGAMEPDYHSCNASDTNDFDVDDVAVKDADLDLVANKATALAVATRFLSLISRIDEAVRSPATALISSQQSTTRMEQVVGMLRKQRLSRVTDLGSDLERLQLLRACLSLARDFEQFEHSQGAPSKKDQLLEAITAGDQVSVQRARKCLRGFAGMLSSANGHGREANLKALDCAVRIGIKLQLLDCLGERLGGLGKNGLSLLAGFDYIALKRLPYTMVYHVVAGLTSNSALWDKVDRFNQQHGSWWSATLDIYHDSHGYPDFRQNDQDWISPLRKDSVTTASLSSSCSCDRERGSARTQPASARHSIMKPTIRCNLPDCCDQEFATKGNLRRHARERAGIGRSVCPNCQETFARKSGRDAHLANKRCPALQAESSQSTLDWTSAAAPELSPILPDPNHPVITGSKDQNGNFFSAPTQESEVHRPSYAEEIARESNRRQLYDLGEWANGAEWSTGNELFAPPALTGATWNRFLAPDAFAQPDTVQTDFAAMTYSGGDDEQLHQGTQREAFDAFSGGMGRAAWTHSLGHHGYYVDQ